MSCPHPEGDRQTRTTQLNGSARQIERSCGRCGAVLSVETEEVRVR
jgi:hypothetical protein